MALKDNAVDTFYIILKNINDELWWKNILSTYDTDGYAPIHHIDYESSYLIPKILLSVFKNETFWSDILSIKPNNPNIQFIVCVNIYLYFIHITFNIIDTKYPNNLEWNAK